MAMEKRHGAARKEWHTLESQQTSKQMINRPAQPKSKQTRIDRTGTESTRHCMSCKFRSSSAKDMAQPHDSRSTLKL